MIDQDQVIVKAIGHELWRVRTRLGWSRPDLLQRMATQMPVNTYACYETGIRPCPIARLVEICQALDVPPGDLISLAMQRIELGREVPLDPAGVRVDVHALASRARGEIALLRAWADKRIRMSDDDSDSHVVLLEWAALRELAILCDLTPRALAGALTEFAPAFG